MSRILIFGKSDIGDGIKQIYNDTFNIPKEECDVRSVIQVRDTLKKYNPDVVVNCAGISHVQVVKDSNIDHWKEEIEVNLVGSYNIARESISLNLFRPMPKYLQELMLLLFLYVTYLRKINIDKR